MHTHTYIEREGNTIVRKFCYHLLEYPSSNNLRKLTNLGNFTGNYFYAKLKGFASKSIEFRSLHNK